MNREKEFICRNCGHKYVKWQGKCSECKSWDSLEEFIELSSPVAKVNKAEVKTLAQLSQQQINRISTGFKEIDKVLGGGLVLGSANLLAGDPGVGKSTLIMQISSNLSCQDKKILYICAEESPQQIYSRFSRFGIDTLKNSKILLAQETNLEGIIELANEHKPDIVVVDSIQMITSSRLPAGPGTVSQIKECATSLIQHVKTNNSIIFFIGHVTKDGFIAGPKILEHLVDTVLYFESQSQHTFRILRSTKNRFGSVPETALFDIRSNGIVEIQNPSVLFINEFKEDVIGSAKFPMILGSYSVLTEIQTLLAKSIYPTPIRRSNGININKLQILLAIMEKKLGVYFSNLDVYLNVVGGLYIDEPAVDLPVVVSLFSASQNIKILHNTIFFGEIDLLGYIRPVSLSHIRITESIRQGCTNIYLPFANSKEFQSDSFINLEHYTIYGLKHIREVADIIR